MPRKLYNHELAEAFYTSPEYISDLVYASESDVFYLWDEYYYKMLTPEQLTRSVLQKFVISNFPNQPATMSVFRDIMEHTKNNCLRQTKTEELDVIAFKDTYFDMRTFELISTNKQQIVAFRFPYFYGDLDMPTPNFTRLLNTSFVERDDTAVPDLEIINLIQEMFGFLLINNLKTQMAFFLVGKGSNGKGVIAQIIENMIGIEYMSFMTLQTLTTSPYATSDLVGKRVNLSGEEESKYVCSSKFKALVAGDTIDCERKFGSHFSFRPYARFIFTTNEIPTFEGIGYALLRRLKIIPMFNIFKGEKVDRFMIDKIIPEMPGVIRWALEGAKRLVIDNQYKFSDSVASTKALTDFEESASSSIMFIRDQGYVPDTNGFIDYDSLYTLYRMWCGEEGKKYVAKRRFIKEVYDNIPNIEKKSGYNKEDVHVRGFAIIKLDKEKAQQFYEQSDAQQLLLGV